MGKKSLSSMTTVRLPDWMWDQFDNVLAEVGTAKGMHVTRKSALAGLVANLLQMNLADQIKFLNNGDNWISTEAEKRVREQHGTEELRAVGREIVDQAVQESQPEVPSRKQKGA